MIETARKFLVLLNISLVNINYFRRKEYKDAMETTLQTLSSSPIPPFTFCHLRDSYQLYVHKNDICI